MERFNYPNLAAVKAEEAEILFLLECESWGNKMDEQEKYEEQRQELENARNRAENSSYFGGG